MFTAFFHFVQSFVLHDSKELKKTTQSVCSVYMLKNEWIGHVYARARV